MFSSPWKKDSGTAIHSSFRLLHTLCCTLILLCIIYECTKKSHLFPGCVSYAIDLLYKFEGLLSFLCLIYHLRIGSFCKCMDLFCREKMSAKPHTSLSYSLRTVHHGSTDPGLCIFIRLHGMLTPGLTIVRSLRVVRGSLPHTALYFTSFLCKYTQHFAFQPLTLVKKTSLPACLYMSAEQPASSGD